MAGDPSAASIWADADVYVGPTDATNPDDADTEFGPEWDLVGLLSGDAGFVESREEDSEDHFAWGGILVRTTRRNFKLTKTFTALENNDVTRELIWPGSPAGKLVVPRPKRIKIGFETREGNRIRRLISAFEAEVHVEGDITDSEADLTEYEMVATIFPDTSESPAVLFIEQQTDTETS